MTRARILVLAAGLAIVASMVKFRPAPPPLVRTEQWMEDALPEEVFDLHLARSKENPRQSYRMADEIYRQLQPYGIVSRVYGTQKEAFEAVVVAGNSYRTFHDPESCFAVADWDVIDKKIVLRTTQTRGEVPMRVLRMRAPNGGTKTAVYCYKGVLGMCGTQREFAWNWIFGELWQGKSQEGAFYRFMQFRGPEDEKKLLDFCVAFLDGASRKSGGTF